MSAQTERMLRPAEFDKSSCLSLRIAVYSWLHAACQCIAAYENGHTIGVVNSCIWYRLNLHSAEKGYCVQGAGIRARFSRILEYRHFNIILVATAVVATLPALSTGLLNDDLSQWPVLASADAVNPRLSELGIGSDNSGQLGAVISEQFAPMDNKRNLKEIREYGAVPWWTYEGLWVRFWRPVASFTHWLDYRIFGESPVAMHAHNILWLGAVVFLVTVMYRRLNGPAWMAGLAGLLFVLDDFTYFPAMWIANRNIFLSLFFGILCVLWHHRWRQSGWRGDGLVSVIFLSGSLLSAEAGIATCAYLFAYAATLEDSDLRERARSLIPAILLVITWRVIYNMLGHGASGGSFYLDPSREPLRYAWAMIVRGPILIMREWSRISADTFSCVPVSTQMILWPIVVLLLVLIMYLIWPLLKANRHARFWAIGMHLSVLPICATMPMNRNLLWVGIGACGLAGHFLGGYVAGEEWVSQRRLKRILTKVLFVSIIIIHLPFALLVRIASPVTTAAFLNLTRGMMDVNAPAGATPMTLNFVFLGMGLGGVVLVCLVSIVKRARWTSTQRFVRFFAAVLFISLIAIHLPLVVFGWVKSPLAIVWVSGRPGEAANTEAEDSLAGRKLVVVNAPYPASFFYLPFALAYEGKTPPDSIHVLSPAFSELEVTRMDATSLKVRAKYGNLLTAKPDHILDVDEVYMFEAISSVRGNGNGFYESHRVRRSGMTAEIIELDDESLPVTVLFKFDVSLEDDSLAWVFWSWKKDRYFPFKVPEIGQRAKVSGPF